jgi:molybdenum cofactor biosynthesis enzyme
MSRSALLEKIKAHVEASAGTYKPTGVEMWGSQVIAVNGRMITEYDLIDAYKRGDL